MDSPLIEAPSLTDLWQLHPRSSYFLARGGDLIPPPQRMDLILTNKCNLRCEICGSQKSLDNSKTPRSHMDFELFQKIAETLFPVLYEVELNSRGDPLLYPQIEDVLETIARHQCAFRIQHNGTLLTDGIIDRLVAGHGIISLSMDAVGPLFDQVRRNGVWEKAEPGLKKLMAARDQRRIAITFYPTVTQRTVGHLFDIVEWAHEHNVDYIGFHDYDPIQDSFEEKPDLAVKEQQFEKIASFLAKKNSYVRVLDDARIIFPGRTHIKRDSVPSALKAKFVPKFVNYPLDADHAIADPDHLCPVPWQSLGVDIEGQINACCRSSHFPFGSAMTVESFADVWFGENYRKLRNSFDRTSKNPLPLPPCEACIHHYAPKTAKTMHSISYVNNTSKDELAFVYDNAQADLILTTRENVDRFGYRASFPLGLDPSQYQLFENEKALGPPSSREDVLNIGQGRYSFSNNSVIFSASDNSDPLRNDRTYTLRQNSQLFSHEKVSLEIISHDTNKRYFALLPASWANSKIELLENGSPAQTAQTSDINTVSNLSGHHAMLARTLYFSTTDGTDPRINGRHYSARLLS